MLEVLNRVSSEISGSNSGVFRVTFPILKPFFRGFQGVLPTFLVETDIIFTACACLKLYKIFDDFANMTA